MRCAIIGLGAVGTAVHRDLNGKVSHLVAVDIDREKVEALRQTGAHATTDIRECADIDVWIVCSSTGRNMEVLDSIAQTISPKAGAIVSVESTIQVGTMHRLAAGFRKRKYQVGRNLYLVHVPHRVRFGHDPSTLSMTRVIGGVTPECLRRGRQFYEPLVSTLHPVSDVRIAELSKVVENAGRYVEIAFAQAVASYCADLEIDFHQLRSAVNTKGNVALADVDYGIGGECLPQCIALLHEGWAAPIFRGAMQSDSLYRRRMIRDLGRVQGRLLLRGVGYKPGSPDLTHSRAVELAQALMAAGREVHIEDPLIPKERLEAAGLVSKDPGVDEREYDCIVERGRVTFRKGRRNV